MVSALMTIHYPGYIEKKHPLSVRSTLLDGLPLTYLLRLSSLMAERDPPRSIAQVELIMENQVQELKIGASEPRDARRVGIAATPVVPVRMIRAFAAKDDQRAAVRKADQDARTGQIAFQAL